MTYSSSTNIMYCLQAFILMLVLCNSAATEASRRSLNNIFNRTSHAQPDVSTFTSTNVTKINGANARYETSDTITPQRNRRLGVGARYTGKKPSDDFIEGNENMHRFFDKMLMSMVTEIPSDTPTKPVSMPAPVISPNISPPTIRTPMSAPVVVTMTPTNTTKTLVPAIQLVCDPPITVAKQEELILSILNGITPESEILTTGTSQNRAFNWLINTDKLKLCPDRNLDIIQRYVVAVTYYSLGGDDWFMCSAFSNSSDIATCIDQERFLSEANVCEWFNITCSIDGSITGIIQDDNNLVGLLPNELQALDQLVNASFYNNTMISGSIPPSYGSLSALKRFDLGNNAIMGAIPPAICNATSLHRLSFEMNVLAGTIPTCLGALAMLRSLRLERNMLTGTLPSQIGRLTSLETLSISENAFTGTIPITLGSNTVLRDLSLQQNILSGGVPTTIGSLTNLESLSLFFNKLNGTIPTELGNLKRLENLFLHFNELTGTMPSAICELRDTKNGALRQLTSDCGIRARIACPADCCTACF